MSNRYRAMEFKKSGWAVIDAEYSDGTIPAFDQADALAKAFTLNAEHRLHVEEKNALNDSVNTTVENLASAVNQYNSDWCKRAMDNAESLAKKQVIRKRLDDEMGDRYRVVKSKMFKGWEIHDKMGERVPELHVDVTSASIDCDDLNKQHKETTMDKTLDARIDELEKTVTADEAHVREAKKRLDALKAEKKALDDAIEWKNDGRGWYFEKDGVMVSVLSGKSAWGWSASVFAVCSVGDRRERQVFAPTVRTCEDAAKTYAEQWFRNGCRTDA